MEESGKFNPKAILAILILAALLIGLAVLSYSKGFWGQQEPSPDKAGERVVKYLNENIPGAKVSLVKATKEHGLYKLTLKMGEEEFTGYLSPDTKLFFPQVIDLDKSLGSGQPESSNIPQRERPDLKLFVMSYCPYGLQAEKALLPVWQLFKEKADIGIFFVDYILHEKKEIDENLRQYCIQKKEPEKFISYLSYFVQSDDFEQCLLQAQINAQLLAECQKSSDERFKISKNYQDKSLWVQGRYPKFEIHSDLNKQYGVSGSPTLIINDQPVDLASRSPEAIKNLLCQAFNNRPEECSQRLSQEISSPGFGKSTGGSSSGSCQ